MALLTHPTPEDAARQRDRLLTLAETTMADAARAAVRDFLTQVRRAVRPDSLTAASPLDPVALYSLFTLADARQWWDRSLSRFLLDAVRAIWLAGYRQTSDRPITASHDAVGEWLGSVSDRLSRTASPTLPESAFALARGALADELAQGSSIRQISQRLAAEFSWDQPAAYWRTRKAQIDTRLDALLNPLGEPGNPVREAAKRTDPQISTLIDQRTYATHQIDRTQSLWQTRAERIARTETTSAFNAGTLVALRDEESPAKRWLATLDERTRHSHREADRQCRLLGEPFDVGGFPLQFPGDPSAPVSEIANCRCSLLSADECG